MASGTFGVVFRAQRAGHPEAPPVALKLAKAPHDPRFPREAELLQRCLHPSIPGYEDQGLWTSPSGLRYPYLVMEWVEGLTLYDWFREQPRSSRQLLQVLSQLAGALAAAHARGAVHRDVKGDNIRVTAAGRAVLVDWGSGWFAGARPLTDTPAPPGTSAYRPPEQKAFMWRFRKDTEARWHAQPSDDLYALGVVLYRCVTGVYLPPCTDGGEPVEREVLPPSAMATVCRELEALTLRLLSDDRKLRGSAEQLVKDTAVRVQTAGTEADRPILPTSNATRTEEGYAPAASSSSEEGSRASSDGQDNEEVLSDSGLSDPPTERECPPPSVPAWLSWVGSSAVGGLVAAGVLLMVLLPLQLRQEQDPEPEPAPWLATPEEPAQFATDGGVAEEALAGVQDVPGVVMPLILAVGKPMPDQPFPGQRKPPCDPDTQLVVYGACWSVLKKEAPCGPNAYDYEGRCLLPFFTSPRKPTSGEP